MFTFAGTILSPMSKTDSTSGNVRENIHIGDLVEIIQKKHQRSGELTEGLVKRILTSSSNHSRGIKVMLDTGEVGRVQRLIPEEE